MPIYPDHVPNIEDLAGIDKLTVTSKLNKLLIGNKDIISDKIGSYGTLYLLIPKELRLAFEMDLQKMNTKMSKLETELSKLLKKSATPEYQAKALEKTKRSNLKKVSY